MKKLLTFLLTALLAFSVGWAATTSVTFSDLYSSNTSVDGVSISLDSNVSVTFAKASGNTAPQYYSTGSSVRMYANNTLTVSSSKTITEIVITFGSSDGSNAITADVGSYSSGTWSGSSTSVIFTEGGSSGNRRIASISVTYTDSDTPAEPNWYRKVTSASDLEAGKKVIFMYENGTSSVGMGAFTSSNYGSAVTGLSIEDNKVNIAGKSVVEYTLGAYSSTATAGKWTFKNPENRYLGYQSATSDKFSTSESLGYSDLRWNIGTDGRIQNNANSAYIKFDSQQFGLFSNGNYAYLYIEDDGSTPVTVSAPTFSIGGSTVTGDQTVDYGTVVTISAEAGNMLSYTTDGTDPSTSSTAQMTSGNTAEVMITEGCTIRAIALDGDANESEENAISITLNPLALTLSPASESVETGETINVTVSANTVGDVIYEYTSSPAGATLDETPNGFSITTDQAGTYTVTVQALDEISREATATGTYTFTVPFAGNWYKKVTSTNDFVNGKKYIVVYEDVPAFLGGFSATSTKYAYAETGPTISDGRVDISVNSNIKELTLTKDGDNLSFHNGDGYLKWQSGNSLDIEYSITNNSRWTASGDATEGYHLTNVSDPSRILQYNKNKGQERFACYTGTQQTAVLYVQDTNDPYLTVSPESQSVELPVGANSATAQFTVNGGNLTGDATVTASGEGFTVSPATLTAAQIQEGATVTVTYNGTAAATGTITVTSGTTQAQATVTVTQAVPTAPVITLSADPCYDDQTVTITAQDGTTIYYTTDGSEPTTTSAQYNGEFTIAYNSENTTVKAIAVNGTQQSTVATKSFAWGTVTISLSPATGSTFQGSTLRGSVTVNPSDAQVTLTGATYNADDHTFTATVSAVGATVTVEATAAKGQSTATATATYSRRSHFQRGSGRSCRRHPVGHQRPRRLHPVCQWHPGNQSLHGDHRQRHDL